QRIVDGAFLFNLIQFVAQYCQQTDHIAVFASNSFDHHSVSP
ncbi:hypothetical protein VCHENC02_2015B, partial [Vibrio harveyi]